MSLKLSDIIPNESLLSDYYRYTGSLTSPPCTEGVIWNVFPQKINISLNQVCLFGVFFFKHSTFNNSRRESNRMWGFITPRSFKINEHY